MHDSIELPKTVDPFRYAAHGRQLAGMLPVSSMSRLLPDLLSDSSEVDVVLEFGMDESVRVPWVKGTIKTCVELQCQRCLESLSYDIIASFLLGLVRKPEEVDRLPSRYDPLVMSDNVLAIKDIIEDELILNIPVVPRHPIAICKVHASVDVPPAKEKNPFDVIGVLKKKVQ